MDLRTAVEAELTAMGIDPHRCDPAVIQQMAALREAHLALLKSVVLAAPDLRPPLTVKQVSERMGVSVQWVYDHIKSGDLKTIAAGGRRMIPARVVEDFLSGVSGI